MRKLTLGVVMAALFAVGLLVGFGASSVDAAGGGGSTSCYYTCSCAGVPLRCCRTASGTSCKVADPSPIQCTQGYNC